MSNAFTRTDGTGFFGRADAGAGREMCLPSRTDYSLAGEGRIRRVAARGRLHALPTPAGQKDPPARIQGRAP